MNCDSDTDYIEGEDIQYTSFANLSVGIKPKFLIDNGAFRNLNVSRIHTAVRKHPFSESSIYENTIWLGEKVDPAKVTFASYQHADCNTCLKQSQFSCIDREVGTFKGQWFLNLRFLSNCNRKHSGVDGYVVMYTGVKNKIVVERPSVLKSVDKHWGPERFSVGKQEYEWEAHLINDNDRWIADIVGRYHHERSFIGFDLEYDSQTKKPLIAIVASWKGSEYVDYKEKDVGDSDAMIRSVEHDTYHTVRKPTKVSVDVLLYDLREGIHNDLIDLLGRSDILLSGFAIMSDLELLIKSYDLPFPRCKVMDGGIPFRMCGANSWGLASAALQMGISIKKDVNCRSWCNDEKLFSNKHVKYCVDDGIVSLFILNYMTGVAPIDCVK